MDYAVHKVESPTHFNVMAMISIMEAKYHTTNIRNAVAQVCVFYPFVSITVRLLKCLAFVHHYTGNWLLCCCHTSLRDPLVVGVLAEAKLHFGYISFSVF